MGKTMEEVREKIGQPSNVNDDGDLINWCSWSDRISVYDGDSGTNAKSVSVIFSLPDKIVTDVHM